MAQIFAVNYSWVTLIKYKLQIMYLCGHRWQSNNVFCEIYFQKLVFRCSKPSNGRYWLSCFSEEVKMLKAHVNALKGNFLTFKH